MFNSHDISIQFPATSQQNPHKILATSHRIRVKIPAESQQNPTPPFHIAYIASQACHQVVYLNTGMCCGMREASEEDQARNFDQWSYIPGGSSHLVNGL